MSLDITVFFEESKEVFPGYVALTSSVDALEKHNGTEFLKEALLHIKTHI